MTNRQRHMIAHGTDLYALLGITQECSTTDIKRAFRAKAMRHHPDRDPTPRAVEHFRAVRMAYETLGDPLRRAAYDSRNRRPHGNGAAPQPPPRTSCMRRSTLTNRPATRTERRIFRGLHATGLCFGLALVGGICALITFQDRSLFNLLLTLPGLLILPDSLEGLRQ